MLSDLGHVSTAVDDLRREIAQAWAHTLGLPDIPGALGGADEVLPVRQAPAAQEAGASLDDQRKDDTPVPDQDAPDAADTPPTDTDTDEHIFRDVPESTDRGKLADGQTTERAPNSLTDVSHAPAGANEVVNRVGVVTTAQPPTLPVRQNARFAGWLGLRVDLSDVLRRCPGG